VGIGFRECYEETQSSQYPRSNNTDGSATLRHCSGAPLIAIPLQARLAPGFVGEDVLDDCQASIRVRKPRNQNWCGFSTVDRPIGRAA
jgi:hypothetical protein